MPCSCLVHVFTEIFLELSLFVHYRRCMIYNQAFHTLQVLDMQSQGKFCLVTFVVT